MRRPSKLIKKIGLPVAAAVAGLLTISPVSAKEKVTYAYLADPALEGVMYAIKTGKVKSDKITIETNAKKQ